VIALSILPFQFLLFESIFLPHPPGCKHPPLSVPSYRPSFFLFRHLSANHRGEVGSPDAPTVEPLPPHKLIRTPERDCFTYLLALSFLHLTPLLGNMPQARPLFPDLFPFCRDWCVLPLCHHLPAFFSMFTGQAPQACALLCALDNCYLPLCRPP